MCPKIILQYYSIYLSEYEKKEILDYDQIYYINTKIKIPKITLDPPNQTSKDSAPCQNNNFGFDDENHEYICEIGDHIAYRYEILKPLGKGSFGQVFKVFDHKDKQVFAMKILINKKRLFKQGLVERKILE